MQLAPSTRSLASTLRLVQLSSEQNEVQSVRSVTKSDCKIAPRFRQQVQLRKSQLQARGVEFVEVEKERYRYQNAKYMSVFDYQQRLMPRRQASVGELL